MQTIPGSEGLVLIFYLFYYYQVLEGECEGYLAIKGWFLFIFFYYYYHYQVLEGECEGYLAIKRSWPGQLRGVYGDQKRFEETYFQAHILKSPLYIVTLYSKHVNIYMRLEETHFRGNFPFFSLVALQRGGQEDLK
jgi:hypothetical protein